jgi:serine/threonine protein kinase
MASCTKPKTSSPKRYHAQQVVAIKKMKADDTQDGVNSTTLREVSLLLELQHPNIVELKEVIPGKANIYLVFEYVERDLSMVILDIKKGKISRDAIKLIMYQLIKGLTYLHSFGILHRDLKPTNILISSKGVVKIADFGLARFAPVAKSEALTREVMTLWYRSPEIMLGEKCYINALDVWSLGCIFAELYTGRVLFQGDCEIGQLFKIFSLLGTPNDHYSTDLSKLPDYKTTFPYYHQKSSPPIFSKEDNSANDLISKMLKLSPKDRITSSDSLSHEYFRTLDVKSLPLIYIA